MDYDKLFGSKVIVFGGDFRQTLPVIKHANKQTVIVASLMCSRRIWSNVHRFRLQRNARAGDDICFSEYLMRIGNGTEPSVYGNKIKIRSDMVHTGPIERELLDKLFLCVFPDFELFANQSCDVVSRAILTPKNETVDELNHLLLAQFPEEGRTYLSHDNAIDSNHVHCEDYLHSFSPTGLPPHELVLKKNCPLMLLRNLNPCEGLCNGTRLLCCEFGAHVISCVIAIGDYKGKHVLIRRILLQTSKDDECPIPFK